MKRIHFSYNWNNKLDCKAFTTIRLHNPKKYVIGDMYNITLQTSAKDPESIGIGRIIDIKNFPLSNLNNYIALLDTGYQLDECKRLIRRMYSKTVPDIDKAVFSLILIVKNQ